MDRAMMREVEGQLSDRRARLEEALHRTPDAPDLVRLLREVDDALSRLESGAFGACEICHEDVDDELLLSHPLIQYCLCELNDTQRAALERDLEMAARLQWALLPPQDLSWGGWETHFRYRPAGPVSGDYCDLVPRSNGTDALFFAVGDVSGKGVAASLLMSHLNAAFRSMTDAGLPVADLLSKANELLTGANIKSHYATLICGRMGPDGQVEMGNAGHCLPMLVKSGEVVPLECSESTGLPVGLFGGQSYGVLHLRVEPGETLFLHTDGLTEARDGDDSEYGAERLASLLGEHRKQPLHALASAVLADVERFRNGAPMADDVTLLAIRRRS